MTARRLRWLVPALAALLSGRAPAQEPHRSGFWLETGSGPGAVRIGCSGCPDITTAGGSSGYLRLGGVLSPKVLLGVETFGFTNQHFAFAGQAASVIAEDASLGAVVLWYPWRGGVFLKGGLGLARGTFTVTPDSSPVLHATGTGVGLTLGAGFDLRLSRRFALTLNAADCITAIGDVVLPGTRVDDVIATMYQLTLGLTVR